MHICNAALWVEKHPGDSYILFIDVALQHCDEFSGQCSGEVRAQSLDRDRPLPPGRPLRLPDVKPPCLNSPPPFGGGLFLWKALSRAGLGLDIQVGAGCAGSQQGHVACPQSGIAVDGEGGGFVGADGGLGAFLLGQQLLLVENGNSAVGAGGVNVGKTAVELGPGQRALIAIDLGINGGQGRGDGGGGPGPARRGGKTRIGPGIENIQARGG